MRLTEFHELVDGRFGVMQGRSMLVDHVLTGFGGRTAAQAIEEVEWSPRGYGGHCAPTSMYPRPMVSIRC